MSAKAIRPEVDFSMLASMDVSDLKDVARHEGAAAILALDDIAEDPDNARQTFDQEELKALSDTIRERGVIEPVLVHPRNAEGKYVLHSGARRYRASLLAGKKDIPAVIRDDLDVFDRFIVNLQRVGYAPLETARFIEARVRDGMTKQEIAHRMGRSGSFVTQHLALLSLPEPIAALLHEGRCSDVTLLYQLGKLHAKASKAVEAAIASPAELTRGLIQRIETSLNPAVPVSPAGKTTKKVAVAGLEGEKAAPATPPRAARIIVQYRGALYVLRPELPTSAPQLGMIQKGSSLPKEVELSDLRIDSIVE